MQLFVERLEALGVETTTCATLEDARRAVDLLCAARGWRALACSPGDRWPGMAATWTSDARDAPFGLSSAAWGIARTGTVVLRHQGEAKRSFSLLPPVAGFFVHASALVESLGDVLRVLDGEDEMPTCVSFISGPSNTSDIASVRCVGVHGPAEVFVWIILGGGTDASGYVGQSRS
jgi:L-lactate utilization protein LutC